MIKLWMVFVVLWVGLQLASSEVKNRKTKWRMILWSFVFAFASIVCLMFEYPELMALMGR
ncbi:MAG: hypothetical protein RL095_3849 [Verrucomicrobiota bacterium]|jgi:divalent metal cation (Fe/Co/Zn/Cd) transporter